MSVVRQSQYGSPQKKARVAGIVFKGIVVSISPQRESAKGTYRHYLYAKVKELDNWPIIIAVFGHAQDHKLLKSGDKFSVTVGEEFDKEKKLQNGVILCKLFDSQTLSKLPDNEVLTAADAIETPMAKSIADMIHSSRNMDYVNFTGAVVEKRASDVTDVGGKQLKRQSFVIGDSSGSVLLHFLDKDVGLLANAVVGNVFTFYLARFYKYDDKTNPGTMLIFISFTFESSVHESAAKFDDVKSDLLADDVSSDLKVVSVKVIGFRGFEKYFRCGSCPTGKMYDYKPGLIQCQGCQYKTCVDNTACAVMAKVEVQLQMLPSKQSKFVMAFTKGIYELVKAKASGYGASEFIAANNDTDLIEYLDDVIGSTLNVRIISEKNILDSVTVDKKVA